MYDAKGLHEFGGRSGFVHVALGTGRDGLEDGFLIHARAGHNDLQIGTGGFQARHDVEQILAGTAAQQDEIDPLQHANIRKGGRNEFEIRFGIEEGSEAHEPQRVALHHGNTDERFLGRCSFH